MKDKYDGDIDGYTDMTVMRTSDGPVVTVYPTAWRLMKIKNDLLQLQGDLLFALVHPMRLKEVCSGDEWTTFLVMPKEQE